jgi:hypothetical protein
MSFHIDCKTLVGLLEKYKGKTFCHLDTCTIPKLLKHGRVTGLTVQVKLGIKPDKVRKYSSFGAGIGYEYAYLVMNRLIKDEKSPLDYQPGESWHVPYNGSTVIRQHKTNGDLYVFVALVANNPPTAEYRAGNKVIPAEDLKEFLPVEYEAKNQGLDPEREVKVRTLKLASVTRLVAEKAEYIVS